VELLDLNGRVVISAVRVTSGLDLSSLESGTYLIRLYDLDGNSLGTQKILKD